MGVKLSFWIGFFLLVLPIIASAITVNPQKYEIKDLDFNKTYNIIITIINPDPNLFDVQVVVNKDSYYLLDNVDITPTNFRLEPNDKKNIKLSLTVPSSLSPEEHHLYLDFISGNLELGKFKLSFTVPGDKLEDLVIERITAKNATDGEIIYFDFELHNKGNVIARGNPVIEIYKDTKLVDSLGPESSIMILQNQKYNISMMYDTSANEPGVYRYRAKFSYNDLETNVFEGEFLVVDKSEGTTYSETKELFVGETLKLSLKLENPAGKLSFYSIQYNIFDKGIGDTVEGQMQSIEKELVLDIDTSGLPAGDYDLELEIKTGRDLENIQSKMVLLKVSAKRNYLWPVILIAVAFAGVAVYILRPYLTKKTVKKTAVLHYEIDALQKRYTALEHSMRGFTLEVNHFIRESNQWLYSQGYSKYGFR